MLSSIQAVLVVALAQLPSSGPTAALPFGRCPGNAPPEDVAPAPAEAVRFFTIIRTALDLPLGLGMTSTVPDFCVTDDAVFVGTSWLGPEDVAGPPGQALAFPRLAFAAGWQQATRAGQPQAAPRAAAAAMGCAVARVGLTGNDVLRLVAGLDATVSGGPEFMTSFGAGYERCAP